MKKDEDSLSKGSIFLMLSKVIFLFSGYGVNIAAARILGPSSYGVIGIIISIMTIMNLFFMSGFPRTTSKYISENKNWNQNLIKKSLKLQIVLLISASLIFILLTPVISYILNDFSLTYYFIITVIVLPFYAVFALFSEGFLNGYRLFKKQAISSSIFSIVKLITVLILLMIGLTIEGVIFGYAIAAFSGFLISFYYFKKIKIVGNLDIPYKKIINFTIPIIIFSVCIFLLFNIDLLSIKAILENNAETGLYTSASMIARIPYFVFTGLEFALLPTISYSVTKKGMKHTKTQIQQTSRYLLMILIPLILLVAASSTDIINIFYTSEFSQAGPVLQILIFGLGFISLISVLSYIAIGLGKPNIALLTTIITLLITISLNIYFIPIYGLKGGALATTISAFIGFLIIFIIITKNIGFFIYTDTLLKIILSAIVIFIVAFYTNLTGIKLIIEYFVLIIIYFGILWVLKEINTDDISMIKKLFYSRRG